MENGKERKDGADGKEGSGITVYSTSTCPYCVMAKDYLRGKGARYRDVDVASDRRGAIDMIKKSGQMGVPVLDIKGKIIVGFDRGAIDAALG